MRGDYGFINAAARTKRSDLLDRNFFDQAANQADIISLLGMLEQTAYQSSIGTAMVKEGSVTGIDEALRARMAENFDSLRRKARKEPRWLMGILLSKYDVENIKVILRALHNNIDRAEVVRSLVPAGVIDRQSFEQLIEQPDVSSCVEAMGNLGILYAKPLKRVLEEYQSFGNLATLELELERFSYAENLRATRHASESAKMVHESLLQEIDFLNLMTVLRIVHEKVELENPLMYFIESGKEIKKKAFLALLEAPSVSEVLAMLEGTSFAATMKSIIEAYTISGNLSIIERQLEQASLRRRIRMFMRMPLSIASVIAYVAALDLEISNLRILIEGVAAEMGEAQIKEELFIV